MFLPILKVPQNKQKDKSRNNTVTLHVAKRTQERQDLTFP